MLELFALEAGANILVGIVTRIVAVLNRPAGHSDDIDTKTLETANGEPMGSDGSVEASIPSPRASRVVD